MAKVNAAGTVLVYAGYVGGTNDEVASGIAVDGSGNAYVTGRTSSDQTSFPVISGPNLTYNGTGRNGFGDAFVTKVNAAGTALIYSGYIGGAGDDWGQGITVDNAGNAYIAGETASDQTTFPVIGGPDLIYNGPYGDYVVGDAFMAKVSGASGYSIAGRVTDDNHQPIAGVSVAGPGIGSTSDASGYYTITDVITGTYVLTPILSGYTFSPVSHTVSVPPNATGLDFTGTLGIIDIGFRPNPDGYQFANSYSADNGDFTIGDMRQMFGDSAVCKTVIASICIPFEEANKWNEMVNNLMSGGHCDGFTITSLRFFKGIDFASDFQLFASHTHDLWLISSRRHIAYYWALQVPSPGASARNQALQETPAQVFDLLRSAMSAGATDPTSLLIYDADRSEGHSILPYKLDYQGGGVWWVWVYDNNYPDDTNRHAVIDTAADTWSYDLGGNIGTWSGDASTHSLGAMHMSAYAQPAVCPWCGAAALGSSAPQAATTDQVLFSGQGHLLITNAQGQRIGYVGTQFVNEAPGAFGSVPAGGLGIPQEPIYQLPVTGTYTIGIDGQSLTQAAPISVTQFGPGYAVSAANVDLTPGSQDQLVITPDGSQAAYRAGANRMATLDLINNGAQDYEFQVGGAAVGAGQVVTLTNHTGSGQFGFSNAQAGGGTYDMKITRVGSSGAQTFYHAGVAIAATDTQYADYSNWNGTGALTLVIDHGSQGIYTTTVALTNQAGSKLYLPLVRR